MRSSGMTWAAYKKHRDRGEYDDYEREQASSLSVVDKDEETRRRYQQYVQGVMASNYQDDIIRNQMMAPYLAEEERRRREEERQREEWQREHIAAQREQVQNGQSVANFDTQAARRKAEPKIRYEQAYDNWNAQNPEYKDKTAEEKYSLFAKELDEQNKLADASQGYRDFYNRNKKDPDFQRMSDDEKHRQYNHYLDQTLQDNGTLPEEQRAEHAEYMYNGLTDKEKALMDTVMRIEGDDYDAYINGGEQGVPFADPTGRGAYSQSRYNEASQAAEARKAAREKTLDDIRAELRHLGWSDEKIDTEFARYTELEDWRKTQESRDKYNQMVNDPALSGFDRAMIGAGYTAADVLSFIPGSVDTAIGYATGDSVYGANTSTKHHNMARMAEEGTSQVRNNLIGDEHPVGQALYDIGVSWGESMSSKLLGAALGPAGEDLSLLPFAISSSDVAYRDAVNRGFSQNQATAYAVTVGALEALTEKLPMDRWQELAKNKKWGRNIFTTALTQMGIEGAEELVNGLGAQMADQLAVTIGNTGKTQARLDIEEMMAQGMSEEEAKTAWRKQFAQQLAMDVISGAAAAGPDVAVAAGVRSFRSRYGNNLNEAISDRYKNLKVEGDTAFENNLREEKAKYENNPVQYIADHYKVNSEEDAQVKQALQEIAEKEKEGKKLSVSDKSFITENVLANRDQFNQEYLDTLFDTGEDSIVPYKYRDVKTEVTEDQARTMLAEAAQSGDPKAFIDAQRKVRNSTVDEVAKHAEELIDFYAGSAMEHGITQEDIGKALIAEKQAYIAGLMGEELNKDNLTPEAQIAYNDGKMDALKEATRTTIENKDALNTDVTTKEGNTVTLKGVFTSDGIMTDGGAVKLENIDLDENKATNKAYHFADNYENVTVKNAFLANINDGQNIENYNRDFGRVYDSALAGLSLENVKKQSLTELSNDQIKNIYSLAQNEKGLRAAQTLNEVLNGVKGNKVGKAINESSNQDADTTNMLGVLAVITGHDMVLVDDIMVKDPETGKMVKNNARGQFFKDQGRIVIRADQFNEAVAHEISHIVETYNKADYDRLRDAVANFAVDKMGADKFVNKVLGGYSDRYHAMPGQEKLQADDISGEMFNDIVPVIMKSKKGQKALAEFLARNYKEEEARTMGQQLADFMKGIGNAVKKLFGKEDFNNSYAREMSKYAEELGDVAEDFFKALEKAIDNRNKALTGESVSESAGESIPRFSITVNSTEEERYEELKDKTITIPVFDQSKMTNDIENLKDKSLSEARKPLRKLGEDLGIIREGYNNKDLEVEFQYSKGNLKESISKQEEVPTDNKWVKFAKMLTCFDEVIDNAELIEVHKDRYEGQKREDPDLRKMFVLVSSFMDEDGVNPVKLEVKDFIKKGGRLYVSAVFPTIEKTHINQAESGNKSLDHTLRESSSDYMLSDILTEVKNNPELEESLGKYIPEQFKTKEKGKFSLSEDSTGRELSEGQQEYFNDESPLLMKDGALKRYYHGTARMDRVGTVFRPERATSGPMAFFTDDKSIAENYAKDKEDTSLSRDERYDSYYTQFRMNINGKDVSVPEAWNMLPYSKKAEIKKKAGHIAFDDDYEEIAYYKDKTKGNGAFTPYELNRHKGNYLETLVDTWLDTGDLIDREEDFLKVLELVGLDNVEYLDPEARNEGVYEVYIHATNPLDTSNIPKKTIKALKDAAKKIEFNAADIQADMWDKNNVRPEVWISRLEDDIKNGTTHSWTSIPDWVTEVLKAQGYDAISDRGGKGGGTGHQVVIPFASNQVKSVDNLTPTEHEDIRFSFEDEGGWIDFDEVLGESRSEEKAVDILAKGMEALKNKDVDVPKLRTLALKIRNEYGSSYNANKLADDLRKAFAYMQTEDHVDYQTMMGILKDIARPVIEEAGEKVGEEEYKHFLEYFKGKKIKLTSTQKEEVRHTFGSYGAYRNAMMPITISDNGEFTLDQLWDEMVQHGGYMLDIDANEGDMPINLLDTLQAMRPYVRNDFGGDTEDLAKDLAMRIVEEYIEGESAKEMRKELTEYRNRLKKDYQERLKNLKGKANAEVLARNKRRAEEKAERQKARDLKVKIKQNANKLYTWAVKPTEGKSVPHNMMAPVMQFLQAIDFVDPVITVSDDGKYHIRLFDRVDYEDGNKKFIYKDLVGDTREDVLRQFNEAIGRGEGTKEQRSWTDKMQGIRDIYNKVLNDTDFEDTDMDFLMQTLDAQGLAEEFDDMLSRHKGQLDMNNLTAKELKLINNVITNIFHAVNQGNKAYSMNADITNLAQDTIKESEGKTLKNRGKYSQMIHDFLRIDNATPVTFFDLLGKGASKIYGALRNGLNQEILDIKKASEFMEGIMKEVDKKEVQKWTGKKATVHEFNLTNGSIKMTDAQIMGLYLTIRRTGGMERIKGGIKVGDIKQNGKTINQDVIHLTDGDIKQIESVLTPEQISLAQKMQKYMAVDCSAQGNETSMKLYGYKKFTDPTYYPWTVDKDTVATTNTSENIPMFNSLERSGFTKQLKEGAKNPLVINDIFDVFTDHVSQMAGYHGYAASLKDTLRWMNYREMAPQDGGFVRYITNKNAINVLSGSKKGVGYIRDLMLDINKARKSDYIGNVTEALMGNYKAAAVGANARVVMQQPTAYLRALNIIDPQYLMGINPATAVKNIKKSQEECPISWWKSKGYYETNLGQPLKEIVTGIASPTEKAKDVMMAPAGYADDITWGFLYTAVEKEQRARFKGQNVSAEEFRKAVNDRFDELVDTTQVVDSALHRSAYMRSKDKLNILQTAFMAEPTKTYNMIMKAVIEDAREGKTMKRTSRAAIAFLLTAIFNAAAQSIPDVWRHAGDDDDYWEKFMEYLQSNFTDNINPLNLLPIVKDIAPEILNFGDSTWSKSNSRFDIDAVTTLFKDATSLYKYFFGESNKTGYGALMSFLRPLSQITGIPMYNLTRDTVSIYNAFFDNLETTVNNGTTRKNEKKKSFVTDVNREKSEDTLDEGIVDALNSGVSIYDLKGAIKSEYKNKYFDAYAEGNTEEAQAIAERAARAYARMGMSDEEIDDEINEWQEETITYALLDKAIASGEGIEDEIRHVQEGKADEKIIKHIMDRFSDTIAYEDVHETESDWRGNVEKALQAIDPTLTFDTANEEAMQQAAEKAAEQQAKEEKAGYKADFFASVESKNGTAGRKALDGLKAMGVDAKSAKTMVSTQYHDAWKEAKTPAEKQKAKSDWMSAYKMVCNYYGVEYKDLDKTWSDWEKDQ